MFAAYGLDVLDARAVSPRRLWVLLHRLPPSARAPGEDWSAEAGLLALLCDHLANLTYITLRASGAKAVSRPKPLPRPRPRARRAAASLSQPQSAGQAPAMSRGHASWMRLAGDLSGDAAVEVVTFE